MEDLKENIFELVNGCPFNRVNSENLFRKSAYKINLYRNDSGGLLFDITSSEWGIEKIGKNYKEGELIKSNDVVKLSRDQFIECVISHVIHKGYRSKTTDNGGQETVDTYFAHTATVSFADRDEPRYVIEWVDNIIASYIFNSNIAFDTTKTTFTKVGRSEELVINSKSNGGGSQNALHVNIDGVDVYVVSTENKAKNRFRSGMIIYASYPSSDVRDKIRNCISFVFGLPIVFLGYTAYDKNWNATEMKAVGASSFDGNASRIVMQPPYPINSREGRNVLDGEKFSSIVNTLYQVYDTIKFNDVYWTYWHAVCAPAHSAAVNFGGTIEQLQRNAKSIIPPIKSKVVEDDVWSAVKKALIDQINCLDIPETEKKILKNKASGVNQAPAGLVFKRTNDALGLKISDIEIEAWKHRNMAAHGGMHDDYDETILSGKILRLLFHRLLAGIAHCSDEYVDYYTLGFPGRILKDPISERR